MEGFTGKPEINVQSKSLKRRVDDLLEWKEHQLKRREDEQQKKQMIEWQEIQQLQSQRVVCKESERLVRNHGERVQDRLTRDALIRRKKQEQTNKCMIKKFE